MFSSARQISAQDIRSSSASQQEPVGTLGASPDGRLFRYALNGAVALAPGKMNIAAAVVTNHTNQTATANAIGVTSVALTVGATAATQDQYKDGYLNINASTGAGVAYRIRGNTAFGSGGAGTVFLYQDEPLLVAINGTTSKYSLVKNPWDSVVIGTASSASKAVGVNAVAIGIAAFGWLQTHGVCSTLINGTPAKGSSVVLGATVGGSVDIASSTFNPVGAMMEAGVDTEFRPVYLSID